MSIISNDFITNNTNTILYEVPKVIVVGAESSGKSSLLENITKCPIFPRDTSICTRQPIHLKLSKLENDDKPEYKIIYEGEETHTTKTKIVFTLENMMKHLGDDISDKVITVYIKDENLPCFEFIDLPGIRAYPEDIATKTANLAEKYIMMENTIILCVAPATTPRLTSYMPISMIKKHNKCNSSMLALTMCDRVQEEDIYDLIIKRLINQSDELEGLGFADCIGVVNRSKNTVTLSANEVKEKKWFEENIVDNIPDDFEDEDLLINSIGTNVLINNIIDLYNKYIKDTWVPNTIIKYKKEMDDYTNKLNALGPKKCPEIINEAFNKIPQIMNVFYNTRNIFQMTQSKILETSDCCNIDEQVQEYIKSNIVTIVNKLWTSIVEELGKTYPEHKFERFIKSIMTQINEGYDINQEYLITCCNNANNAITCLFLNNNHYQMRKMFIHIAAKWYENMKNHKFNYKTIHENSDVKKLRKEYNDEYNSINKKILKMEELLN